MKRLSVSLRVLLLLLVPVYYGACATVQSGGWGSDPPRPLSRKRTDPMKRLSVSLRVLLLLLVPVYYGACATVQSGGWGSDPLPTMSASVMSAKVCTAPAVIDPSPNVNKMNGWTSLDPAGGSLPICSKQATPYYCSSAAGCGEMTYGTRFVGGGREPRHIFFDLLTGTVKACAQPAQRFGVGGLECQRKIYSAANGPVRVVLESALAGADSSTELSASISAEPGAPVAIGQIGPVEPR